jgi:HAD superfamily hydrolase (TIGR01509 family)
MYMSNSEIKQKRVQPESKDPQTEPTPPQQDQAHSSHRFVRGAHYRFDERSQDILELERGRVLADGRLFTAYLDRETPYIIPDSIRGLIFDFDGTLVPLTWSESIRQRAIIGVIRDIVEGSTPAEPISSMELISSIYREVFGKPEVDMCEIVKDKLSQSESAAVVRSFLDFTDKLTQQMTSRRESDSPIRPQLRRVTSEAASRGLKLAAVSNSDMIAPKAITKFLPHVDLNLSTFAKHDPALKIKPHPDMLKKSCEKMGLSPSEVLVFEDSATGAIAALRAGMKVLLQPSENRFVTCQQINLKVRQKQPDLFETARGSVIVLAENARWSQPRFS